MDPTPPRLLPLPPLLPRAPLPPPLPQRDHQALADRLPLFDGDRFSRTASRSLTVHLESRQSERSRFLNATRRRSKPLPPAPPIHPAMHHR